MENETFSNLTLDYEDYEESREEYINRLITFYGEGILLTAVSTFGLIGNVMSIIVLTRSINARRNHNNYGMQNSSSAHGRFQQI